jgi:rod shape-determining protein MreD
LRKFRLFVTLLVCGVLVTCALPWVAVRDVRPDLFLIVALAAALVGKTDRVLWAAWATGLAKDFFSAGPPGAYAMVFLLMALLMLRIRPFLVTELPYVQALLALTASLTCQILYFCGMWIYHPHIGIWTSLLQAGISAGLTAAVTPLLMPFLVWLMRRCNISTRFNFGEK